MMELVTLLRRITYVFGDEDFSRQVIFASERSIPFSLSSSSMSHDRTGKPVVDRDKSHESGYEIQRQNSENEQIRTLLDRQRGANPR